jgi:hypothetical protein
VTHPRTPQRTNNSRQSCCGHSTGFYPAAPMGLLQPRNFAPTLALEQSSKKGEQRKEVVYVLPITSILEMWFWLETIGLLVVLAGDTGTIEFSYCILFSYHNGFHNGAHHFTKSDMISPELTPGPGCRLLPDVLCQILGIGLVQ